MKNSVFTILSLFFTSAVFAETFVYVSESKDKKIAVFSLDESNGDLKRIGELIWILMEAPGNLFVLGIHPHCHISGGHHGRLAL